MPQLVNKKTGADPARIALLVLDFDGVLTDNRVLVNEQGVEAVFCHRGDGFGLERLGESGVEVIVLSKERNPVVAARCRKLGLACHQGEDEKLVKLIELCRDRSLQSDEVAYVGNDINDLECLAWAGLSVAVADAVPAAIESADWVTVRPGGYGAVREVCDVLLHSRQRGEAAQEA